MTASLNQIYKAIGSLEEAVKNLAKNIEESDERAAEGNRRADQHRTAIHKRVDDLVGDFGDLKESVAEMKSDVADTKTVTDEVRRWKLMGVGALFVTGIAASAIASALTYFWSDIIRALRGV